MTTRWEFERAVFSSGLPAPSRLLLLTLAAHTEAATCVVPAKFTPSLTTLADRTGLGRRTVVDHLDALDASGWLDRRKPDVADQRSKRARTQYRLTIPTGAGAAPIDLPTSAGAAPALVQEPHQSNAFAGAGAAPNQNKISKPHQISRPSNPSDPFANLDATEDERTAVITRITKANPSIRNRDAYLATLAANGDLADHLNALRAEHSKTALAAELVTARQGPECVHGRPGGAHRRSDTGRLLCPQCQTNTERNTA